MNLATETSAAPSLCWAGKSDDDVIEYILSISKQLQREGIPSSTATCVHQANAKNNYLQISREKKRQQEMLRLGVMLFGAIHQLDVNKLRTNYKKIIIRIHPDKNHHEHAHDVFQIVHTCFEYMQERIKLEQEHLKQRELYSANKQTQECRKSRFTRSNCINRVKCSKLTSLPDNKPQRFYNLMQSQSYPCTANLKKTTIATRTGATNYAPSLFSQTHVPVSSWHKPFPWKMRDRMEHRECDYNGVSQTHISHTTSLSFTHATLPSRLFTRKQVGNANKYRWEVPHNSRTRDMHVNKKELHHICEANHVDLFDTRAKQKQQSTIVNKEDVLSSHEHYCHYIGTKENYNSSKHHHVGEYANASRDNDNDNNNIIISGSSNSISNNSGEEQMHDSMSQVNDNYSKRNWEDVEEWARHILDSESDNDSIDATYDNENKRDINTVYYFKIRNNSFMCNDDDNSDCTNNHNRYEGNNKYYYDDNCSSYSSTRSSDDDMWGEMEKTNNDIENTQCQQIRHKTRVAMNKYNPHKHEKSLSSNMCSERFHSMPCYDDYCDYNEHHDLDKLYLTSLINDKSNKEEYSQVCSNDSKSYNKAKHNFHFNLSFCSSLSFSSELSSPSHYSSHTSLSSSSSNSTSPFS